MPEFPSVPRDDYSPMIISGESQDAILEAIPWSERGIFLAMGRMGLRPGEARALNVEDYHDGWMTVSRAAKGTTHQAPIRGTKTRRSRRLPVDPDLRDWIEENVRKEDRLNGGTPLFQNPRAYKAERRWILSTLDHAWKKACQRVGVQARLYEGTKHAMATDAMRRGVQERHLQAFLGHRDVRSTRRYAKLVGTALVSVLRVRRLSVAENRGPQPIENQGKSGGADGIRTRNFRRDRPVL